MVHYSHVFPSSFDLHPSPPPSPDALDKRCEDLQFHNHTLLDDKKQLQETLGQMKAAGSRVNEGGGLERELRELQDSFHQKVRHCHYLHRHTLILT